MDSLTVVETNELEKYEQVIETFKKSGYEAGIALKAIQDKKLYRQSHETFEDYLRERWGYTKQYGYMLIDHAQTVRIIEKSTNVDFLPVTEGQTRPLVKLEPKEQVKAWEEAVKLADGDPVTGKIVKQAVDKITHKEAKAAPKKADPSKEPELQEPATVEEPVLNEMDGIAANIEELFPRLDREHIVQVMKEMYWFLDRDGKHEINDWILEQTQPVRKVA